MTNIIQFKNNKEDYPTLPKQRVFYLGYRYVGPMFCQDVQNLYLKRKGIFNDNRYWAIITYGKYDENSSKEYSIELEECHEDDVIEMIDMIGLDFFPFIHDLRRMGWRGKIKKKEILFSNLSQDTYYMNKNSNIINIKGDQ